jgi:hypothetical protein
MADFSPQELDQLEDALENLEGLEDFTSLGLSPALTERLGEYQDVLRVSREALPMEDVSEGCLDGVLAEAREAKPVEQPRVGVWERWRKTLIPVFALAGTTAAVLWIVRPDQDVSEATATLESPVPAAVEPDEGAAPPPPATEAALPTVLEKAKAEESPEADASAEDAEAKDALATPAPQGAGSYDKKANGKMDAAPAKQQAAAEPINDKDRFHTLLERADDQRKGGNCREAESLYRELQASAVNGGDRARILKGLGLCAELSGGDFDSYYEDARALDPRMEDEIARERAELGGMSKKGKPKKAKKRKSMGKSEAPNPAQFEGE